MSDVVEATEAMKTSISKLPGLVWLSSLPRRLGSLDAILNKKPISKTVLLVESRLSPGKCYGVLSIYGNGTD